MDHVRVQLAIGNQELSLLHMGVAVWGSITSLIRPWHSHPSFHGVTGHLDLLQHARRLRFEGVIPCRISCRSLSLH
jgi:hypothetical protein